MTSLILLLTRHDERALHALVLRRRLALDLLMRRVTRLGDAWVIVPLALALLAAPLPEVAAAGRAGGFGLAVSHLWVQLLKRSVSRPRPRLPVGCASLVEVPDRFSFPSGHAAAALSVALPAALALPPGLGLPILALGAVVGVSRCYLGVHYPGDVLAGWALAGAASGLGLAWVA